MFDMKWSIDYQKHLPINFLTVAAAGMLFSFTWLSLFQNLDHHFLIYWSTNVANQSVGGDSSFLNVNIFRILSFSN